jgi:hypothetical protein
MWNTFNYCGELDIKVSDAENCTIGGVDATPMIKDCIGDYAEQFSRIKTESIVKELTEYGIEDVSEMDRETLEMYLFWIACGNISEEVTEMDIHNIWDNGGETLDRYTVVFNDFTYLSLSENGLGVSMWGETSEQPGDYLGTEITLDDLSSDTIDHILYRVREAQQ